MKANHGGRKASVLVVEDDWLISAMLCDALESEGYEVHSASSGEEAIEFLIGGEPVDALFTDINLGGAVDGAALALRARELKPDIPVVYASNVDSLDRLLKVPASIFLPKPYDPEDACRAINRAMNKVRERQTA